MPTPNPIDPLDTARAELAAAVSDPFSMQLPDQIAHIARAVQAVIAAIEGLRR